MEQQETTRVTRLAPSPTGTLHLGNALTFVVNWALARKLGWRVVLRMEDLDRDRVKPGAVAEALAVMRWLGLDWDEGPVYQSADLSPYAKALGALRERGLIYPCSATRNQIEQALSAPNEGDDETRYPGIHRPASGRHDPAASDPALLERSDYAWRLIVPDGPIGFLDQVQGQQSVDVQAQVGDFPVATKAGLPAYQLAVVVDDARQGVTDVVRGDDLISSTPRQVLLYELLGLGPVPRYWHLPLVRGGAGRRLAKRDGSVRLTSYMQAGVAGERVLGLLARWAGLIDEAVALPASAWVERIDPRQLTYDSPVFTPEDERWLMAGAG